MTSFMDKLKANIEKKAESSEHPIIDKLENIPDNKEVNPPATEHPHVQTPSTEPDAPEPQLSPKSGTCPNCKKEFKHLSRHKCKKVETPEETKIIEEGIELVDPPLESSTTLTIGDTATSGKGEFKVGGEYVQNTDDDIGIYLYIDSLCIVGPELPIEYLIDFIKPVTDLIEKENNVEHWGMIEFGKGEGQLSRRLERYIEAEKPACIVYCDSSTKEGRACKEVLKRHAVFVVQGIR